ncbi:U6 snRNA-associated Sm-like protein LSm1 [Aspergillus tanneri]|uniref:U6 snRNA-associated Sm-like protein LSm1 n=1 Tax=Aspergillus tanneri TaxID=1220188 RepID=A0A5M9N808_9EURO|nr:SM-like, degradation of cytoplasmic mRNAs and positively regulates transcription initiation [Aspergillus tanneri]KAA8650707.1 SM-like, degradation of cytoplasmic mRNAs and positively regulates transcription initiation [Aspergillus tanneri]
MERHSINDPPAGPQQQGNAPPGFPPQQNNNVLGSMTHGPPQLPPQMFTTAAQLLDLTDKKLVLVLRDGRKLIGVLRSWDQFANLVLQDTIERMYAGNLYADIPRGIFLVRGENVLLLGEIDLDKEDDIPASVQRATIQEVFELKKRKKMQSGKRAIRNVKTNYSVLGSSPNTAERFCFRRRT